MRDTEVYCRPVPVGALFVPTRGLHFQALHPFTFLFICTLHCCKHCTRLEVAASFRKLPLTALCVDAGKGDLLARPGGCTFCTRKGFAFSRSSSPNLHFHVNLALVQALYQARGSRQFSQISTDYPMRRCGIRR